MGNSAETISMHDSTDKFMTTDDTKAASIAIVLVIVVPVVAAFLAALL
jgi:hypothetical protein